MRVTVRGLGCFLVALALSAGTAVAATPAFVLEGRGWGHGVGMSQWGAEGLALHGWGYRSILAHYYPGTALTRAPNEHVRVLLAEGRSRFVVSSKAPFRVTSHGRPRALRPGRYVVPGRSLRPPLRFEPGAAPLALGGSGYRGEIVIRGHPGSLLAVNSVPVERYLRGVLPWEMPFHWRPEALEAQAVAARSYALSQRKPWQSFDVFADARDQIYGGIRAETSATNLAVGATAGQVLSWEGRVALTYYCSASGGQTEAVSDAIPGMSQVPYLVSVPDPYDSLSPHHRWGPIQVSPRRLASRLHVPAALRLALALNGSGRVAYVEVSWGGGRKRIPGRSFQAALDLPSTWFTVRGGPSVGGAAPPARGGDWPADRSGWTIVLDSVPESAGLPAARAVAARAAKIGAPSAGVLVSSSFSTLRPGFYVVFSGVYSTAAGAAAAGRSLAGRFPKAYVRQVVPY